MTKELTEDAVDALNEIAARWTHSLEDRVEFKRAVTGLVLDEVAYRAEVAYEDGYDAGYKDAYDEGVDVAGILTQKVDDLRGTLKAHTPLWNVGWPKTQASGSDDVELVREEARDFIDEVAKVVNS